MPRPVTPSRDLCRLVTGRLPFEGANAIEIEDKHLHAPPPRASERAPVPPRLDEVIARCMEKQKEARYAGVAALLEELRQVGSAAPAPAPRCLGVHVTALIEGDADDDAVLDALDAVLDQARECLEAVGLSVAVETGNALLAVAALDEVDPDQVLDAVRGLAGDRVAVSVHVAPAERRAGRFVGGELFRLGAWEDTATGRAPAAGTVTITGAARSVLQTAEPRPVTC
jgi:eukaryotic-like serine/threonine-protein kinase